MSHQPTDSRPDLRSEISARPSLDPSPTGSPPARRPATPSALPQVVRPYQQLLRGPRHRWWRPLLALFLALLFATVAISLLTATLPLVAAALGIPNPGTWAIRQTEMETDLGPVGFLYLNLALIALIPSTTLAIWAAHRIRGQYVSSVTGGLRWRWLLRCVLVTLPLWAVYLGLTVATKEPPSAPPAQWLLLMVIAVLLTPWQAAGEEYLFRGLLTQSIGSWFAHPVWALLVPTAVSVAVFAAAHGSFDVWVLASLAAFALTASVVTWWTGGLEAAIAIHAVNNVGGMLLVLSIGGWNEAFVSASSRGTVWEVLGAVVVHAIAVALIVWQARKADVQRHYRPDPSPDRVAQPHGVAQSEGAQA